MSLLVLIGPPGALVADVTRLLSQERGVPAASTDSAVSALLGESLDQIAIEHDQSEIRRLERDVAVAFLRDAAQSEDARVLALGSGCLGDSADDPFFAPVRAELAARRAEGGLVVELTGDFHTLVHRTHLDGPRLAAVFSPRKIFYDQLQVRETVYRAVADHVIDTSGKTAVDVARHVGTLW
ncbi:MAG: hypothetical protein LKJ57_06760 [Ancrocorticia sp.]|jgi:shikimate kinase|nr:hypothetical protein [Ancrocorticia sp.]MCI1895820.1 hypothetical protein [Ancrocorticia sp.]MCI1932644.1 hypothetical protein [Ancrocorticia sp.]MCI1964295.1 hypothetical protein [Ancrocorticia sp.]MCI2002898.1 hypothetical protein [Ancrocorticia sp.]